MIILVSIDVEKRIFAGWTEHSECVLETPRWITFLLWEQYRQQNADTMHNLLFMDDTDSRIKRKRERELELENFFLQGF